MMNSTLNDYWMKAYSVDLRQKVVDAYEQQEGSQRELAKRFKVSPNFVRLLLKRHQTEGTIEPKPHTGGFDSKLANHLDLVKQLVEQDNDATLAELCAQLKQQVQIQVSSSTLCRTLQQLNLTRKKTLHASQAETDRVQLLRQEYREEIRDIRAEDLVFIDETGVNLRMVRFYARALKGERATGERPYKRGSNVTLIGAMSLKGMVAALSLDGGINGDLFKYFIEYILVPNLWVGACVVMDNLSSHGVDGIRELIEAAGAKLVYLSPYSPDFNPIENCWSKVKEFLRSVAARSREALDQAMTDALNAVTLSDIKGWFTYRCYCT